MATTAESIRTGLRSLAVTSTDPPPEQPLADLRTLVGVAWSLDARRVVVQMALLVLNGLVGGVGLLLLVPIVSSVADGAAGGLDVPVVGSLGESWPLAALLGLFVAFTVVQSLVQRSAAVNSAVIQQRIVDRLRYEAFEAILAARWSFVLSVRRSDIVQVVTLGAMRSGMAVQQLVQMSVTTFLAVATSAVALIVAPGVTALALVGVSVAAFAQAMSIRPAHRLGREFGERNRELQAVVTDSLDSLRLVRAHDASSVWVDRLASAFTSTRAVQIANVERSSTVSAFTTVGMAVAASGLVLVATWAEVSPASIVVLVVLIARLSGQVLQIVRMGALLANALPAVGEIRALTETACREREIPAHVEHVEGRLDLPTGAPLLEMRGVTYRYGAPDQSGGGVTSLDLVIPAGRITALTGPSGAGKSTTADLVLGLLTPTSGEVLVAGRHLTPGDLAWWRSQVAYVPQESLVLPGTLRDNLVWSVPGGADDDACRAALRRAAADFADRLPDGLDTVLGDRGIRLSGGERQRVAIARALLRDPVLLVLDEATSALDDATEATVLDTIANLAPAVSVLVIAHRRTTLDLAHEVVRIVDGRRVDPTT